MVGLQHQQSAGERPAEPSGHLPQHGTRTEYVKHGCRCPECREANSAYSVQFRLRRGATPRCIALDRRERQRLLQQLEVEQAIGWPADAPAWATTPIDGRT